MVHGVGIDIVQLSRIARAISTYGERFLKRVYSPGEIQYCEADPAERVARYAARFAAKEAAFKAFRDDPASRDDLGAVLSWRDFEVARNPSGAPALELSGRAAEVRDRLGITAIHVSLSRTKASASAIVIAEK